MMRVHRDPFEPIMCVLEADSPLAEYRKITDEIVRHMPDEKRYPRPAAEAVRSFLLLRLACTLGSDRRTFANFVSALADTIRRQSAGWRI